MNDTLKHYPYDAILTLGIKLGQDGAPPQELLSRVALAARCFQKKLAPLVVLCGGQTKDTPCSEASVMEKLLLENGVPKNAILCEDKSQVTYQNIQNAKALLNARGIQKKPRVLIVTSDYHVFRARYMARSMGFRAVGVGCDTPNDELKKIRRKKERLFFLNYALGWETGRRKRPVWYERAVAKIK